MATNYNHPPKGSCNKVEPIRNINDILAIRKLLHYSPRDQLLFLMGINNGLRIGDLLGLKTEDVRNLKPGQHFDIIENRTGMKNILVMNQTVYRVLQAYLEHMEQTGKTSKWLFQSRKGGRPLTLMRINAMVKQWASAIQLSGNFGARSLRKTWGYHQVKEFGVEIGVVSKRYNHEKLSTTRSYLGLVPDDMEQDKLAGNELG